MIPGGGAVTGPPSDPAALDPIVAQLDGMTDRAGQLEQSLTVPAVQTITTQQAAADAMATQLQGAVGSGLTALEATAGRTAGKLVKQANRQLGQAYTYAFPYGITYPTNEQALYGLQSGDSFGSMGIQAPGVPAGVSYSPVYPGHVPPPPTSPAGPSPTFTPAVSVTSAGSSIPAFPPPAGPPPAPLPYDLTPQGQPAVGGPPPPPNVPPPAAPPPPPPPVRFPAAPPPPAGPGPVFTVAQVNISATSQPCPPGQTWTPDPNGQPPPVDQTRDGPNWVTQLLQPVLTGPIAGTANMPQFDPQLNAVVGLAWTDGSQPATADRAVALCLDSAHFQIGQRGVVKVYIPSNAGLYYSPVYGYLRWSDQGPPAGWGIAPTIPCPDYAQGDTTGGFVPAPVAGVRGSCQGPPPAPPPPPGGFCPAPQPPACPAADAMPPPKLTTADGAFCDLIDTYLTAVKVGEFKLADWISMGTSPTGGGTVTGQITKALLGSDVAVLPDIVGRFGKWLDGVIRKLAQGVACDPIALTPVVLYRAVAKILEKYTGTVPAQLLHVVDQMSNTICQSLLPGVGEADRAWLADAITDEVYVCWVKAAGAHVQEAKAVRNAGRERPTFHQAQALFRRQQITQERFDKLTRQSGVTNDDDKTDLFSWSSMWPSLGETTRWAGEQLFDDDVAKRFELDDGFDQLWLSRFRKFFEGHGGDQELARYHWMAHWRRPGVGELIEMTRRLRPDEVAANVAFTEDDLDAALKQEGYNDYWSRRVKAIAYRVAQRRDVQRLYDYHLIDESGMKQLLQDQGYQSDFADQLVTSWGIQRQQLEYRYNGGPPASRAVADYAQGYIGKDELQTIAGQLAYYPGQEQDIVDNAMAARDRQARKLAVGGLRKEFTSGLINIEDAQAKLVGVGMDPDAVQEITQYWFRLKASKPKQVAAATLCTWRKSHLLRADEQMAALTRLGYSGADARKITDQCSLDIAVAQQKAEQKHLDAIQKAADKAAKEAAKAAANATRRVRVVSPASPAGTATGAGGPNPPPKG